MSLARQPGQGRYARRESERRWLVAAVPPGAGRPRRISDRYLTGTSLRLRRVEDDGVVAYKLGQKVRVRPGDPSDVRMTNLYLTAAEHERLAVLPAAVLDKTRWLVPHGPLSFAVDVFDGRLGGLLLAEIELPGTGSDAVGTGFDAAGTGPGPVPPGTAAALADLPAWLGREVTFEDRYSGGALAAAAGAPAEPG